MFGANAQYEKYLWDGALTKSDRYGESTLLDFSLVDINDGLLVKLTRGAYITVDSATYPKWFTGYVTNEPELEPLGTRGGAMKYGYRYKATSDDFILSLKPIGIIPTFLNIRMGAVIRYLASKLCPGVFNTSNVDDGPMLAQFVVNPDELFKDVVQRFCEASAYKFRANDNKLYFKPQDELTSTITLDKNNTHFTPKRLVVRPSSSPIINDITVLGNIEPQAYVHEYFIGTGLDSTFPLVASVFGLDNSVFIDETFSGSAISSQWAAPTTATIYPSNGALFSDGGVGYMRSKDPIPMDSRLRLTHGEWKFTSGAGVIGGLWTSDAGGTAIVDCLYGINVSGTTLNPIVDGVVDSAQSFTISTTKRYVLRTIAEFSKAPRLEQVFSYIDQTGTRGEFGGDGVADKVVWTTLITEIDPADGTITKQDYFVNEANLTGVDDNYAFYVPVKSTNLVLSMTGITVSIPLNATLELAHKLPLKNSDFELWVDSNNPLYWEGQQGAFQENEFSYWGYSLKLQANASGFAVINQPIADMDIDLTKKYTVNVRLRKTNLFTTGSVRLHVNGTGQATVGTTVTAAQMDSVDYNIFTGTLIAAGELTAIPDDLALYIEVTGAPNLEAVFVDDIAIISEYQQQLVGPNEVDASDGLAPVATIVSGNLGQETKSTFFASSQFNPGQSELVFFKDSYTRSSDTPPENQVIRLSYRSAGAAVGRSISLASINDESAKWGDHGHRSVIRTDLAPRPRTAVECEMAAAALIKENSYLHWEGTYEQYSTYFSTEPRSGSILKFVNMTGDLAPLQAEEISEVNTKVITHSDTSDIFLHTITFGKPNKISKLLAKFNEPSNSFLKPADYAKPPAIDANSIGLSFAKDVVKPVVTGWDDAYVYVDVGQNLDGDLHWEVRYTNDGWGCDDGTNLITRTSSRTFRVPRNLRGRTFFIKQVKTTNLMLWSEDQTKSNYSGATTVTKLVNLNPDGDLSEICEVDLAAGVPFVATSSASGTVASFHIKGGAGTTITATFGTGTKVFTLTGFHWQRISISSTTPASAINITCSVPKLVSLTRFSAESGTTTETAYIKTKGTVYGAVSRYPALVHVSFPIVDPDLKANQWATFILPSSAVGNDVANSLRVKSDGILVEASINNKYLSAVAVEVEVKVLRIADGTTVDTIIGVDKLLIPAGTAAKVAKVITTFAKERFQIFKGDMWIVDIKQSDGSEWLTADVKWHSEEPV